MHNWVLTDFDFRYQTNEFNFHMTLSRGMFCTLWTYDFFDFNPIIDLDSSYDVILTLISPTGNLENVTKFYDGLSLMFIP